MGLVSQNIVSQTAVMQISNQSYMVMGSILPIHRFVCQLGFSWLFLTFEHFSYDMVILMKE